MRRDRSAEPRTSRTGSGGAPLLGGPPSTLQAIGGPTTPLVLLALWAFSRSSQRFHDWILEHRVLGPPVRRWRRERLLPLSSSRARRRAPQRGSTFVAAVGFGTFTMSTRNGAVPSFARACGLS